MKKKFTFILFFAFSIAGNFSPALAQKQNSKTYTNPIAEGIFMGDPFVLKHENQYYLYGTTSTEKGFECWTSENMLDWKYEGFVYEETPETWGEKNYWAPEVAFYKNEFYLTYSCKSKDTTRNQMLICLAKSSSPTGPFKDIAAPWIDLGFSCIDGHLFFDNGKNYLFFDKVGYEGKWPDGHLFGEIYAMELDENLMPSGDTVFCSKAMQPWENPESDHSRCNEGSFVFKHGEQYYMTYSANHFKDPFYGIGYSTAPSPLGPWKKSEDNPIIGLDKEKGVFGPGHNSFTHSPDNSEFFIVYHTHISEEDKRRQVNIDRVKIDENGKLKIIGPTRNPQKVPSGVQD